MKFNLYKTWKWGSKLLQTTNIMLMYYTLIFNLFTTISIIIIVSLCNILHMLVYTLLL